MEVRFARLYLKRIACGRPLPNNLPSETIRQIQMIVFWFEHTSDEHDYRAFPCSVDEGGTRSFLLSGGFRLCYEAQRGVIRFTELLYL